MNHAWPIAISLSLTALAAFGCADTPPEEQLVDRIDVYVDQLNEQAIVFCDCFDEAGHENRSDCQEANGEILPSKRRCYDDAFVRDIGATNTWLDCLQPLEDEFTSCLNTKLICSDLGNSATACVDDYGTGRKNCIELPASIERALEDCEG